jgi:hypothetical protein
MSDITNESPIDLGAAFPDQAVSDERTGTVIEVAMGVTDMGNGPVAAITLRIRPDEKGPAVSATPNDASVYLRLGSDAVIGRQATYRVFTESPTIAATLSVALD